MFSMSPTLMNSLQSLYNQYRGPQMQGPMSPTPAQAGMGQFNPMMPLWMQGLNMQPPQAQPISSPIMGPALNLASPPGMATQPASNPNILALLQKMMSGTPLAGTTPPTTNPQQQNQGQQNQQQQNQQQQQQFQAGGNIGR